MGFGLQRLCDDDDEVPTNCTSLELDDFEGLEQFRRALSSKFNLFSRGSLISVLRCAPGYSCLPEEIKYAYAYRFRSVD